MAHSIGPTELNQSRKRKDTIGAMESSFELHGRQRKQFRSNALHISQKGAALRDTIFQTFVYDFKKSEFDKTPHEFLPINVLDGIFDYDIETEVGHQRLGDDILELIGVDPTKATEDDHELTQFIMHDARTILFIGIYIDHPSLYNMMLLFKEFSFTDASLPITWDPKRWREEANKHPLATMEHKFGPQSSNIWPLQCMHKFQRDQWRFLPATISCARNSHDFGQRILPFIEKSAIYHGGAHGYVQAYKIHPAHVTEASNLLQKQQCEFVAVKEFKHSGEKAKREWEQEVAALKTMNAIKHEHIVQFLTAFTRGDDDGLEHYVVFEFATGGNLDDFWKHEPSPKLAPSLIKWVVEQMHGLATALAAAHYQENGTSYRHGDLKPANILWFKSADGYGTLKIGDWGEARCHEQRTSLRDDTQTRYGTRRYEPPELARSEQVKRPRSRLYDVWSFGCIALEFVIWLMYGRKELDRFNLDNGGKHGPSDMFYELDPTNTDSEPIVHQVVTTWISHMSKQPACHANETDLGALLEVIRTGLLVVNLPADTRDDDLETSLERSDSVQSSGTNVEVIKTSLARNSIHVKDAIMSTPSVVINKAGSDASEDSSDHQSTIERPARMLATDLEEELGRIKETVGEKADWDRLQLFHRAPPRQTTSGTFLKLPPNSTQRKTRPEMVDNQVREPRQDYGHPRLDPEDWEFLVDNDFAGNVMSRLELDKRLTSLSSPPQARLCETCVSFRLELYRSSMRIRYSTTQLKQNSVLQSCDLCRLLWKAYSEAVSTRTEMVAFERRSTTVWIPGMKHPVLTLYQNKDEKPLPSTQIGLPELPDAGGDICLELISGWIDDCERNHSNPVCRPPPVQRNDEPGSGGPSSQVPTRLIDVGTEGDMLVHLRETKKEDTCSWTALSYRWGSNPYSTTRQNIKEHVNGMELSSLPQTFKDAIKITRAIGQQYLWIDSICIVQGEDGDFSHEALRMEDVYSGAYCVIAASGATDLNIGFLTSRKDREYVALPSKALNEATLYICQTIENFREHVLQGALSNRGWVLQEHALARRTIFFTEYQTYWECGHGVRCETMVKMKNASAALLGDPDFPQILNAATYGERIIRFQKLYEQYSRLQLSAHYDRPTAIAGLEQRLLKAMGYKGGFGILDDCDNEGLLRRSLLWHRGKEAERLRPIEFPRSRDKMPSWSWMAYSGAITYYRLDWLRYDWQYFQSPWRAATDSLRKRTFITRVRTFDCSADPSACELIYEDENMHKMGISMGVVLAVENGAIRDEDRRQYLLVVRPIQDVLSEVATQYERIGAGYVSGKCLHEGSKTCNLV